MRTLGLDIGTRRTGVAFLDDAAGVAVALDTLKHESMDQLVSQVLNLAVQKKVDQLVLGLPVLPSGEEGSQAALVRSVAAKFEAAGLPCRFVDERYSTDRKNDHNHQNRGHKDGYAVDPDAASACVILGIYQDIDIQ